MEIHVFKTDVHNKKRVSALAPHLENMSGVIKWNIDLHDVDKVLRVECVSVPAGIIEESLHRAGFFCEELQD